MFVRFRKIPSGGFWPAGMNAALLCRGDCRSNKAERCPRKPRCRWHVWPGEGIAPLAPYRLTADLVESRRVAGKVRQQHIACLGSIEGHLLESFTEGLDAAAVEKIRDADWQRLSLRSREEFWQLCLSRMWGLADQIGADEERFTASIDARVPRLSLDERAMLDALDSEAA